MDATQLKEGIINTLKMATSKDELEQYKEDIKNKLGYNELDPVLKEAIDDAFSDSSIKTVVNKNEKEKTLKLYENRAESLEKINFEYEQMN